MVKFEHKAWSPLWLEYAGLPKMLGEKIRGGPGWPVFKKIVELDCAANAEPDAIETSLEELAGRLGMTTAVLRKTILALRKLKLVACFLPDGDEEPALLKVRTPLDAAPLKPAEVAERHPELFAMPPQRFRYWDDEGAGASGIAGEDADGGADPALQEIVDLYFNAVGLKMNAFVLDELRLVRHRFAMDRVRRTFRRAQQNEIRSLTWIVRELVRDAKRTAEGTKGNDNG